MNNCHGINSLKDRESSPHLALRWKGWGLEGEGPEKSGNREIFKDR